MKTLDDFNDLVKFYNEEAKAGHYHSPSDVEESLLMILAHLRFDNTSDRIVWEDKAFNVAKQFWDM